MFSLILGILDPVPSFMLLMQLQALMTLYSKIFLASVLSLPHYPVALMVVQATSNCHLDDHNSPLTGLPLFLLTKNYP